MSSRRNENVAVNHGAWDSLKCQAHQQINKLKLDVFGISIWQSNFLPIDPRPISENCASVLCYYHNVRGLCTKLNDFYLAYALDSIIR